MQRLGMAAGVNRFREMAGVSLGGVTDLRLWERERRRVDRPRPEEGDEEEELPEVVVRDRRVPDDDDERRCLFVDLRLL